MKTSSLSAILLLCLMVFTFPIWIGIAGGLFGIMMGIFGAAIGILGAIFGVLIAIIVWPFQLVFGGCEWPDVHFGGAWLLAALVLLYLLVRKGK